MLLASPLDMEEARRRNVNADELGMKPVAFDPAKLPRRAGFELKIDGIGLLDLNANLSTLEGAPFEAALHLAHELGAIREAFGTEMVLHGEFFERGGFNATLSAFNSGQSTGGAVVLWDAVTLKAWHGFEQSLPLHERRAMLEDAVTATCPRMVKLNPLVPCSTDVAFLEAVMDQALDAAEGGAALDGIVVKDLDSPYVRAKSPYWLKMKPCETIDVPIQSVRLTETGHVQSIVLTVDGKPAVVGSGISAALRHDPLQFRPGRIVEVRCIGRTAGGALRGASFCRFRDDKEARA